MNLDDCNVDQIPNFKYLVGRRRLLAQILYYIPKYEQMNLSKQETLEKAINRSVNEARKKLTSRFKDELDKFSVGLFYFCS